MKVIKFFFLLVCLLSFLSAAASIDTDSWSYVEDIEIEENSGQILEDFQVVFDIDTEELIERDRLEEDCSDLVFTTADNSELDFWIDDIKCDSPETSVFVKVPEIPADSTKAIRMYHGNPESDKRSNPENTFDFYEDFSDGSTEGWSTKGDTGGSGGGYSHSVSSQSLHDSHSAKIDADANCFSSPYDGTDAWYDKPVDLDDQEYKVEFTAKAAGGTTDFSCGGSASPELYKNDLGEFVGSGEAYCSDSSCSTCETDWGDGEYVIDGAETSSLSPAATAGDCERSEERWYDRIFLRQHVETPPTINKDFELTICDRRGLFQECISDSSHPVSGRNIMLENIFKAESTAVFEALDERASITVSNSTTISGLWQGSFDIQSDDRTRLEAGAQFQPEDGRISIN